MNRFTRYINTSRSDDLVSLATFETTPNEMNRFFHSVNLSGSELI